MLAVMTIVLLSHAVQLEQPWMKANNRNAICPVHQNCFDAPIENSFLLGCSSDNCAKYLNVDDALAACAREEFRTCGGIVKVFIPARSQTLLPPMYELRRGNARFMSAFGEAAYLRKPPSSECNELIRNSSSPNHLPSTSPPVSPTDSRTLNDGPVGDPYVVLQVSRDASQSDIRKAYRKLAQQYHPDQNFKNPDASQKFIAVGDAYGILGDPDKRAAFDDFGTANEGGFGSYWEYQRSNRKSTKDFYVGDMLVQRLTDQNWNKRTATSGGPWIVEFYAPWCTHCVKSTSAFKAAADQLDGRIEFGAINGVSNNGLVKRFGVSAYPSIFLFSARYQIHEKYPWKGPHNLAQSLDEWSRGITEEWSRLFDHASVERLTAGSFKHEVLESTDLWFIMFTNGARCSKCADVKPNFYRLSADVAGLARFGELDCSLYEGICAAHHVPIQQHRFPHIFTFPNGTKSSKHPAGESLFMVDEISTQHVFPAMAKLLRAALRHPEGDTNAVSNSESPGEYGSDLNHDPPPTPMRYAASPTARQPRYVQVGSSGQRRMRIQ